MEILRKYKQNGYFTPELFHLLEKKKVVEASEEVCLLNYIIILMKRGKTQNIFSD